MEQYLTIENNVGTEFRIEHTDDSYGVIVNSGQLANTSYTQNTVTAMSLIVAEENATCNVTDPRQGGLFKYNSSNIGKDNDGTFFGGWKRQETLNIVNPLWFGASGDGIADDTVAMQKALAWFRYKVELSLAQGDGHVTTLDLQSKQYKVTESLDFTNYAASHGYKMINGSIIGHCTGKPVVDCTGSSNGKIEDVVIVGDSVNRPSIGILNARGEAVEFADCKNWTYSNVVTTGYFSQTALYTRGQISSAYYSCRFWNKDKNAYAVVHTGMIDAPFTVGSEFTVPSTKASVPSSNNTYTNLDCGYDPADNSFVIASVTNSSHATVVTETPHNFSDGEYVVLSKLAKGMTEISNTKFKISDVTGSSFKLNIENVPVDSTAYGAYEYNDAVTFVAAQTITSLFLSNSTDNHYIACHADAFGSYPLTIHSGNPTENCSFGIHFQGYGYLSNVHFTGVETLGWARVESSFFRSHGSRYSEGCFSTDATTVGKSVMFINTDVSISGHVTDVAPPLFTNQANFKVFGSELTSTTVSDMVTPSGFDTFSGNTVINVATGDTVLVNYTIV